MLSALQKVAQSLLQSARDLAPVLLVVIFFQLFVIREPLPGIEQKIFGFVFVLIGLTLFVRGLDMSIFPLGENLAYSLARSGSLLLLISFAFLLGFGSTFAEPALNVVIATVSEVAAADTVISTGPDGPRKFATALRYGISASVGLGVAIGAVRIVLGWPAAPPVLIGYCLALLLAIGAPAALGGVAFDAGAAATSAINIPLITALGVGIATVIRNRNPMMDGFGLVAFASVMATIAILLGAYVFFPFQ
jgi:Protein of unknown function (DUF1538)